MYKIFKRMLDLIVSVIVLVLFSPVLIPIIILLRLTAEGEIFYFQKRVGYKNNYFNIWKFATMLKNSPNMGTGSLTLRNDSRVTKIGRFLRMTKINELPQIINILKGDMTLVGPRPQMQIDFEAYPQHIQDCIYDVPPGITGIGSVIFRDEEKMLSESSLPPKEYYKLVIAPYKGNLEVWYQQNMSVITDLKILFLTFWVILVPESKLMYKILKGLPKREF